MPASVRIRQVSIFVTRPATQRKHIVMARIQARVVSLGVWFLLWLPEVGSSIPARCLNISLLAHLRGKQNKKTTADRFNLRRATKLFRLVSLVKICISFRNNLSGELARVSPSPPLSPPDGVERGVGVIRLLTYSCTQCFRTRGN